MTNNSKLYNLYSSAYTLSDMELFIFPDLLYAAVLANIISPVIWEWKKDPWFKNLDKMNTNQKIHRLKQFIMQKYVFNLDLETWGLTKQSTELDRFKNIISKEDISKSNALFGYQGDKYYFSLDIRKHFGLDKYDSNVIPYWKTETVEAMDAFNFKTHFKTGAGECVSLSLLYTAALFIVLSIPLEDIFLMATPLHSQNFVITGDGLITNNRRIITKNMWFNGTEISNKARRALMNEQVTYISHISGYIHSIYNDYSIAEESYKVFQDKIRSYLISSLNSEVLVNFLRSYPEHQKHFQFQIKRIGKPYYLKAESAFSLEHTSKNLVNKSTRKKLLEDADHMDLSSDPIENRLIFEDVESRLKTHALDLRDEKDQNSFKTILDQVCIPEKLLKDAKEFICIDPALPDLKNKNKVSLTRINIVPGMDRLEILNILESVRDSHQVADLCFHAGRYCKNKEWPFFLKAAIERNPVSLEYYKKMNIDQVFTHLKKMSNKSIYSDNQFAQPDEVSNFLTGDGMEKAFVLANIILNKSPEQQLFIFIDSCKVILTNRKFFYLFDTNKKFSGHFQIKYEEYNYHPAPFKICPSSLYKFC
ncbi:MAG: hypothetical protein GY730_07820 [bacterium]|nr:hypothetical protein [bacterium]